MKPITFIFAAAFCCFFQMNAQEKRTPKQKPYDAWIKLNTQEVYQNGVFYKIGDTSITLLNKKISSPANSVSADFTEYSIKDIRLLKTRKEGSIKGGAMIGSVLGFLTGSISVALLEGIEDGGVLSLFAGLYVGFGAGVMGMGAGALAGSLKDRFPLNMSFENLDRYQGVLQEYSYEQEIPFRENHFEHKFFLDCMAGPAFPTGILPDNELGTDNEKLSHPGFSISMTFGYQLSKQFGLSVSQFINQFSAANTYPLQYWQANGIVAGPLFTFPVRNKLNFLLNPCLGFITADYLSDNIYTRQGTGAGIYTSAALSYNLSKRWYMSAESRYLYSMQQFKDQKKEPFQSLSIELGMAYRFSRYSLRSLTGPSVKDPSGGRN